MLGDTDGLSELRTSKDQILADSGSEFGDDEEEENCSEQILYSASFEELARNSIKYDTVIWLSISLLLVLAWGIGLLMLLYLPFRRYVLRKDFSSRRLYVTQTEIVYKVVYLNCYACSWCCIMSLIEKWFFFFPFAVGQGVKAFVYTVLGDHNNWETRTSFFGDWYYYWTRYWCRSHPTMFFVMSYTFPLARFHIFLVRLCAVYIWCPYFSSWKYCSWKGCSCRCTATSRSFWPQSFEKGIKQNMFFSTILYS